MVSVVILPQPFSPPLSPLLSGQAPFVGLDYIKVGRFEGPPFPTKLERKQAPQKLGILNHECIVLQRDFGTPIRDIVL